MPFRVSRHRLLRAPAFRATLGLLVFASCALAPAAHAQSVWLDRDHEPSEQIEVLFPSFLDDSPRLGSTTWFLAARLGHHATSHLVLELPYAHAASGSASAGFSDGSIGNPYVGWEVAPHPSGLRYEFGLRIPVASTTSSLATGSGIRSDVEREEAFVSEIIPVRFAVHFHQPPGQVDRIAWDVRLVPSVWLDTNSGKPGAAETFLGYLGTLRYEGEQVRVGGGFTGRRILTARGGGTGASSQFDFMADFLRGSMRPGVQLKIPLSHDLSSFVNPEFGLIVTLLPHPEP